MNILIINAGSSSIKYKVYIVQNNDFQEQLSGLIENIGAPQGIWRHTDATTSSNTHHFANHEQAFQALADKLLMSYHSGNPIHAVGHRVVQGGEQFYQPTLIDDQVLDAISQLSNLAPIHNPINVQGIVLARRYFSNALHAAVFDTGFHHTLPPHVHRYPIQNQTADAYQIRKYGFHGINHEYVAETAAQFLNKPLSDCNLITLHLGNGASACLIKNGRSHDTSMGMTPLAGLVMGTRCGDIDPAIPLYLINQNLTVNEVDVILNKKSGLLGIGGNNDMRVLLNERQQGNQQAALAIEMYVYAIQKIIGAYLSQLSNLDALIFTGGVGENAAVIRSEILMPLQHFNLWLDKEKNSQPFDKVLNVAEKKIPILIIRGDEERLIAEKTRCLCLSLDPMVSSRASG